MKQLVPIILIFLALPTIAIAFGPFPVKGKISNGKNEIIGEAKIYPKYVEIFDLNNQQIGKVGIMVDKGLAKLFLVQSNKPPRLVGYASGGKLYNSKDSKNSDVESTS